MKDISLAFYKDSYKKELSMFSLPDEQSQFTAYPLEALKKCELDQERFPIVILWKGIPAGFFVLHGWNGVKTYSENQNALLLRAFSIDSIYQGKGMAKQSIKLLPAFVKEHFPHINEIVLGVNHANSVAQHVYLKGGFMDKGKRIIGKKGEQFVFHLTIN
ncbi:GNAT family N-acetyltransferase [Salirhabdus sp. Marseille-P4669]|uniref:GNAT family N-acetyltransferase n=1 Tax=Salirhabdus sp. Marseille-P4669 TaxID=2042310 RepID=UPI000C7E74AB|nr:GNAT family N-acetyltransferase [Salirhabdus sp. Marseille-P4669]